MKSIHTQPDWSLGHAGVGMISSATFPLLSNRSTGRTLTEAPRELGSDPGTDALHATPPVTMAAPRPTNSTAVAAATLLNPLARIVPSISRLKHFTGAGRCCATSSCRLARVPGQLTVRAGCLSKPLHPAEQRCRARIRYGLPRVEPTSWVSGRPFAIPGSRTVPGHRNLRHGGGPGDEAASDSTLHTA
jgi:hypothetical protein